MRLSVGTANLMLRLQKVTAANQAVVVAADVSRIDIASPDPSQKVMVREELLDANPGRPGAPISIPGLPIETHPVALRLRNTSPPASPATTASRLRSTSEWEASLCQQSIRHRTRQRLRRP